MNNRLDARMYVTHTSSRALDFDVSASNVDLGEFEPRLLIIELFNTHHVFPRRSSSRDREIHLMNTISPSLNFMI